METQTMCFQIMGQIDKINAAFTCMRPIFPLLFVPSSEDEEATTKSLVGRKDGGLATSSKYESLRSGAFGKGCPVWSSRPVDLFIANEVLRYYLDRFKVDLEEYAQDGKKDELYIETLLVAAGDKMGVFHTLPTKTMYLWDVRDASLHKIWRFNEPMQGVKVLEQLLKRHVDEFSGNEFLKTIARAEWIIKRPYCRYHTGTYHARKIEECTPGKRISRRPDKTFLWTAVQNSWARSYPVGKCPASRVEDCTHCSFKRKH